MNTAILNSAGSYGKLPLRRILLLCGILSSLLYGTMVTAIQFEGYNMTSQSVSELSAIGAPTRNLWIVLGITYQVLMIAFASGVWISAGNKRSLRFAACLILFNYGVASFVWPFASMHQREVLAEGGKTIAEAFHGILVVVTVLCNLSTIAFGAAAFGSRFRLYSIITILVMLILGVLTGPAAAPLIEANLPTPWFGIWERIIIMGFLIWIVVLAITLMRTEKSKFLINHLKTIMLF